MVRPEEENTYAVCPGGCGVTMAAAVSNPAFFRPKLKKEKKGRLSCHDSDLSTWKKGGIWTIYEVPGVWTTPRTSCLCSDLLWDEKMAVLLSSRFGPCFESLWLGRMPTPDNSRQRIFLVLAPKVAMTSWLVSSSGNDATSPTTASFCPGFYRVSTCVRL